MCARGVEIASEGRRTGDRRALLLQRPLDTPSMKSHFGRECSRPDLPLDLTQHRNRKELPTVRPPPVVRPILLHLAHLTHLAFDELVPFLAREVGEHRR